MKKQQLIFLILSVCFSLSVNGQIPFTVTGLKSEHLENPIGIDSPNPRLSWQLNDERQGAKQTAFRIIVGTDSINVHNGQGNSWDTGKMESEDILVAYAGKALDYQTRYYWKVIVWNHEGEQSHSPVCFFETGMMGIRNWQGAWIGDGKDIEYKPAPYFRKGFTINKTIQSARAYIAVAGLYELYINGEKVGDHRLDPMYTRFDRRNLYVTYDVTKQIENGQNAVGVLLGNGWYNHQSKAVWDFDRAPWRNRPAFCMDICITYTDGSTETIPSDLSWKTSSGSLVLKDRKSTRLNSSH